MASTSKPGTLEKAGKTVKKVARKVANAADEFLVEPAKKVLGLKTTAKKSTAPKKKPAARSTRSTSRAKSR